MQRARERERDGGCQLHVGPAFVPQLLCVRRVRFERRTREAEAVSSPVYRPGLYGNGSTEKKKSPAREVDSAKQ